MPAPAPEAPFSDKMAYYRTQHTSRGVRFTHLVGTHVIAPESRRAAVRVPG